MSSFVDKSNVEKSCSTIINNQNISYVSFKVKYETKYGQSVYIIGGIEELGKWDPSKALPLYTSQDKYPMWKLKESITCPVGMEIDYKYLVKENNNYIWEVLSDSYIKNRHIAISSPGKIIVYDVKGILFSSIRSCYHNTPSFATNQQNIINNNNNNYTNPGNYGASTLTISSIQRDMYSSVDFSSSELSDGEGCVINSDELILYNNIMGKVDFDDDKLQMNMKLTANDKIIIVSTFLPFLIEKKNNTYHININDDNLVYVSLFDIKEQNLCDVVWVGMLRNFFDFNEIEQNEIYNFLKERNIFLVMTNKIDFDNYLIYVNNIIKPIFYQGLVDVKNEYFLNHQLYFNNFLNINRIFSDTIISCSKNEDLIIINDITLSLVPNFIISKTFRTLGFYIHFNFPSNEILKAFPAKEQFLNSIVLCDIIGFHTFRHAFNLLSSLNKEFDKNFEIKNQGNLVMNYSGREILIYIKKAECDYNFLKKLKKNIKNNNNEINDKFKKLTENKFSFLSINNIENPEILFITLKAYEIFLEKNINNNNKDNFILVFILLTDNNNTKNNNNDNNNNLSEIDLLIDKKIQLIKDKYGEECIYLERKNDFFSIKEQIKIFGYFNILLYLQIEIWNGLITYGNEFIALQQENKKFGVIINEVIVINKNLKSIYIINPYNKIRIYEGMQYYYNKNINEINSNYKQDMSIIQKFNSMNWILKFLYNLKKLIIEQSNNKKSTVGFGFNLRIMKLNMNFNHLNLDLLKSSYISSKKGRIFFLNYFSLIEPNDIEKNNNIISLINDLSKDNNNLVYLVTNLKKDNILLQNLNYKKFGIAYESGFYYKEPYSDMIINMFDIHDWSWKKKAKKIFNYFKEKTEGSSVIEKDSNVVWSYKNCDLNFWRIQANELLSHLNNIFEDKKLDIINGKDYIEIKPQNLNKGYFISKIIQKELVERRSPDLIICIGDDDSDEDMFKYLSCLEKNLMYRFLNKLNILTATISKKPSNAKFYINENDFSLYIDSLIHISNINNNNNNISNNNNYNNINSYISSNYINSNSINMHNNVSSNNNSNNFNNSINNFSAFTSSINNN